MAFGSRWGGLTYGEYLKKRQETMAANAPARAAEKARKQAASMTCQCCGRKWMAATGKISHHGYQRPGGGWQTASCMGARFVPFEMGRERLGGLIQYLKEWKARQVELKAETEAGTAAVPYRFTDYKAPREKWATKLPVETVQLTAENYESLRAEWESIQARWPAFEEIKARKVRQLAGEIAGVAAEILAQEKRFAGWKKTHEWAGKEWKAIA